MNHDKTEKQGGLVLDLWLPGYHTPSLNVTKGHHWSQYYRLKKEAASALLSAISDLPSDRLTPTITQAAAKLSRMCLKNASRKSSPMTARSLSKCSLPKKGVGAGMKKAR